jgi:F1F0 ATPase subunit 2
MLVRLEMDAERMNLASFDLVPAWTVLVGPAAHLVVGFGLGILYFRSLWWSARRFAERGSLAAVIALMAGRFAVIGGALALASLEGALPLLTMALGVIVARFAVLKGVREAAP